MSGQITSHPAEGFVKYLITLDPEASDDAIFALLQLYDLTTIPLDFISRVHSRLGDIPPAEKLADPDTAVLRWLRKQQIGQIWLEPKIRDGVIKILEHKRVKTLVERMTISGYQPYEIAQFLSEVTAGDVRAYIHYVFDLDKLTPGELQDFLAEHSPLAPSLWANRGPDAKQFVLHHEGLAPVEATLDVVSERIVRLVNDRLFRLSPQGPSVVDSKLLKNYSDALVKAAAVLGEGSDAAREFKKVVDSLVLRPENDGIKTYESVVLGKENEDEVETRRGEGTEGTSRPSSGPESEN